MSANVIDLTKARFEEEAQKDGILFVDCWAAWCGACADFAPVFERVAGQFPQHTFGKLNTQEEKEATEKLRVEHIPTLLLFRDGILLFRQPGYFDEEKLVGIIKQAESIDMNEVRSHLAAEEEKKSAADNDQSNAEES